MYTHIYTRTRAQTRMYTYINTYMHMPCMHNTYKQTRALLHACVHACMCMRACMRACAVRMYIKCNSHFVFVCDKEEQRKLLLLQRTACTSIICTYLAHRGTVRSAQQARDETTLWNSLAVFPPRQFHCAAMGP
jgi:hypothetical protein